jgi:acyl-CoA thioester hydrolase
MNNFETSVQVRWADLDPNFHVRHSVYYDWGALCRLEFLFKHNLRSNEMQQFNIGPILFREECIFKKEIHFGDNLKIDLKLFKAKRDISRWSIQHTLTKNDSTKCAIITVDGAWLDTRKRSLTTPPELIYQVFDSMPKAELFEWLT